MLSRSGVFSETLGAGDDLVVLHGWGMSSRFMRPFAASLAAQFRVTLIDLPGHGRSGLIADLGASGIAAALLELAPPRAHWLGWSLGAMLALQAAALAPAAVRSLTLLAGTPRFVAAADWPGVDELVLSRFAADLHRNYDRTIERFLALQLHGMDDERNLLKALRAGLAGQRPPLEAGLLAGLEILRRTDLRSAAAGLESPCLMLLGRRDRLIPAAAGAAFAELKDSARVIILEGAAHIPFWTHTDATCAAIEDFLERAAVQGR